MSDIPSIPPDKAAFARASQAIRDMSCVSLAAAVGVTPQYLAAMASGRARLGPERARRAAEWVRQRAAEFIAVAEECERAAETAAPLAATGRPTKAADAEWQRAHWARHPHIFTPDGELIDPAPVESATIVS